jgi:3-amino-5-hydroxybenzoate synthase
VLDLTTAPFTPHQCQPAEAIDGIPSWPMHDDDEVEAVTRVIRSGNWWRVAGGEVKEFEAAFAEAHGCRHALAVTNGTHGLELALLARRIGPGDEVIVPAMTFISTATAVMRVGAVPVPVDVDPKTYCIDPTSVAAAITDRTRAVIPVHMAGHIADMDALRAIAREHDLFLLEDACHAQGATWRGRPAGSLGDAAVFSFQAMKLMTAGEGGIVTTNDDSLWESLFLSHNVGRAVTDRVYHHVGLGSNYRMTELQGAVLSVQLSRLAAHNRIRESNARFLTSLLSEVPGVEPQGRDPRCTLDTHYMFMFRYDPAAFGGLSRDHLIAYLNARGVPAYRAYSEIHRTETFRDYVAAIGRPELSERVCAHAADVAANVIWLHHRVLLADAPVLEEIAEAIASVGKEDRLGS